MPIKNFKIKSNQSLWDKYYDYQLSLGKKSSIPQYKPVLLHLERITDKPFSRVTVEDLNTLYHERNGNNFAHLKGFYMTAVGQSWMKCQQETLIYLLPGEYQPIVRSLLVG